MRRALAVAAILVGALVAPATYAQDGRQILQGILGGIIGEIDRKEQRRRDRELFRQLEPIWHACAAGDLAACHAAAQFPLNPQGRVLLQDNLLRAIAQRQTFERNWYKCQSDNVDACDAALTYPFVSDHSALITWRNAAIERQKDHESRERDRIADAIVRCHAGDVAACDVALSIPTLNAEERAQVTASRDTILRRQAALKGGAEKNRAPQHHASTPTQIGVATSPNWSPWDQTASPRSYSGTVFVIFIATLLFAALLIFRQRNPLAPSSPLTAALSSLFRPLRPTTHQETCVMRDDRELLVSGTPHTHGDRPPLRDSQHASVMVPGQDKMKIKIRRDQVAGLTGKVTFSVNFIAELSPQAREAVRRYRFAKTVLYQKDTKLGASMNIFRLLWRVVWLWITRKHWQITIGDLVHGRTIQCKDILEVLDVEERIMAAAKSFAEVLRAASWFGGEEIVEL